MMYGATTGAGILFGENVLGTLAEATGIAAWVGGGLREIGIARTGPGLLLCAIALAIVVTEFASNTATTSLLVPVVIATAQAAGLDPVAPALGATLGASCAFVFPVSTPPNAIILDRCPCAA
jgi:sodium-dependent dicarboxylate transporter 2/3/5